ncbi:MAG: TIGR00159 family protein [Chloroflexi bacterium]|nr:TIGR00159 family protein [Chloroflexota bacterium]
MDTITSWLPTQVPRLDWRSVADIVIVAVLIYGVLMLIKGTTAVMVVRGIAVLVLVGALLSKVLDLPVLGYLLRASIPALIVAIPILFQQELRRALEQIGRAGGLLPHGITASNMARQIDVIAAAAHRLSDRRWGALVVLERGTALGEYAGTGVELDAILSVDLLEQIFHPNTRLHDGAAIVRGERVFAAACVLPLAEGLLAGQTYGTRHRAAIGITEQTDALSVVVSEETGQISIANNGRLVRNLDEVKLRKVLSILYRPALGDDIKHWLRPRAPAGGRVSLAMIAMGVMGALERLARWFGGPKAG